MFPGFHVMAMSMYGLEIDRAGVSSIPIDMVDLKLVSMVEEQFTGGAAPALLCDQGGQSRPDRRVLPASLTPIHPIPIVRTPIACDFRVAQTGGVTMGGEGRLTRTGGWRGTHLAGFLSVPGPVRPPPCRFVGVSPARPGTPLHPGETIQATKGRLTYPSANDWRTTREEDTPMHTSIRLGRSTVKDLYSRLQHAYQHDDVRLVRRITV